MSSPTDPAQAGSSPSDPAELRREIEQVRGELAETVNALADKADVKSQARDKAQQLKAQATVKAQQVRVQAPETAQQLAGKAQQVVQDKPGAVVGTAVAVLGLLILRRRRRRRKVSASSDLTEPRRDIEELRGGLADMVNALATRADAKGRAQEKAEQLKVEATKKAQQLKVHAQASAKALLR